MSKSIFSAPHFNDEAAAYAYVEARIWANGRVCPHCGVIDRSGALKGKTNRIGLYKCYACRKPFTVKVGTIFEDSHIAMRDWLTAIHLICSSKKGVSSNQLHRTLGITLKSAWFMSHRIREAMKQNGMEPPMGGDGEHVEVDETYIGRKVGMPKRRGHEHKHAVLTLVQRGGEARSFHVDKVRARDIAPILARNISKESTLQTDEAKVYIELGKSFSDHQSVNHVDDEWVERTAHTNTVEGYYSIFKRGMKGIYQHCDERHLHRYLAEFDFRYTNREKFNAKGEKRGLDDTERADKALKGVSGKRLTYQTTLGA